MCDPTGGFLIAAAALAVASTGVSAVSQIQQANYQTKLADQNAKLATESANAALDRGKIDERNQYRKTAAVRGAQNAAMAANGIDTSFGSALDIARDTDTFGAQDAQTVRDNALATSKGYSIQSANYTSQGNAAAASKTGIALGAALNIGSTIAGSAAQFGGGGGVNSTQLNQTLTSNTAFMNSSASPYALTFGGR